jgi:hypothetical protein
MNCYFCNQQRKDRAAVAICIVCGMALCAEHLTREELPVFENVSAGMGTVRHRLPATLPRILCPPCKMALDQKGEDG